MSAAPTAGPGAQSTRRRAAHARRRPPHCRRWLAILAVATVAVVVVVAVTVAGGYGYARLRVGQVPSVHVPSLTPAPPPGRPMTLLVVGSDSRQGLRRQDRGRFGAVGGQRGDVILLVHLVPASHRAWVLSIPRDLYVPVAGTGGRAKINAALARGPEQLVETIRADFGIPVSHYLLVDFDGFRALVDAVGGIRLDFPSPARDDDNGHNNSGLLVTIPGCRHLDGDQALALARSRYYQYQDRSGRWHADPGYDLGRIRRQQVLLRALAAKALGRGLANPLRANAVLAAVAGHLTRDDTLTLGQAVRLAGQFRAFRPGALVGLTIPTVPALRRGQVVLRPGQPGFEQAWAEGGLGADPAARPARDPPDGGQVPRPARARAPLAVGPDPPCRSPSLGPPPVLSPSAVTGRPTAVSNRPGYRFRPRRVLLPAGGHGRIPAGRAAGLALAAMP